MKYIQFFFLLLFGMAFNQAKAQLRVYEGGEVSMERTIGNPYASLCIGNYSAPTSEITQYKRGIGYSTNTLSKSFNVGILSTVAPLTAQTSYRAFGVLGIAGNATSGYNYGVAGGLTGTVNGAGIYGSVYDHTGVYISGKYAGYFKGATYVDGTLTATSVVTPSDMRLKDNVTLLSEQDGDATLDNVMNMNVISYNYKERVNRQESDTATAIIQTADVQKLAPQRHYGLSAQELQKIYPDLVQEGQDGYLAVNYTELVPILIRSIQELKAELDDLKGNADGTQQTEAARRARQSTATGIGDDAASTATQATLYQNSPNPFTSQTVIRFSLPENAPASYIYIFDMQGKMVKQLPVNASMQSVTINGYELQAGIYLYSLVVGGQEVCTKRMILSE